MYLSDRSFGMAFSAFEEAARVDPTNSLYPVFRVNALIGERRYNQALKQLDTLLTGHEPPPRDKVNFNARATLDSLARPDSTEPTEALQPVHLQPPPSRGTSPPPGRLTYDHDTTRSTSRLAAGTSHPAPALHEQQPTRSPVRLVQRVQPSSIPSEVTPLNLPLSNPNTHQQQQHTPQKPSSAQRSGPNRGTPRKSPIPPLRPIALSSRESARSRASQSQDQTQPPSEKKKELRPSTRPDTVTGHGWETDRTANQRNEFDAHVMSSKAAEDYISSRTVGTPSERPSRAAFGGSARVANEALVIELNQPALADDDTSQQALQDNADESTTASHGLMDHVTAELSLGSPRGLSTARERDRVSNPDQGSLKGTGDEMTQNALEHSDDEGEGAGTGLNTGGDLDVLSGESTQLTMSHEAILQAQILRAQILLVLKRPAEAQKAVEWGFTLNPKDRQVLELLHVFKHKADCMYTSAAAHVMTQQYTLALIELTSAIELCQLQPHFYVLRSTIHREMQEHDAAVADLCFAHNICTQQLAGKAVQSYAQVASRMDDSPAELMPVIERNLAQTYNEIAIKQFHANTLLPAIRSLTQAIELDASVAHYFMNRGDCYRSMSEFERAVADYHQASERKPGWFAVDSRMALLHHEIGRRLFNNGAFEDALVELDRALNLNPQLWQCLQLRAKTYTSLHKMLCAYKDLHKALQLEPGNEQIRRELNQIGVHIVPTEKAGVLNRALPVPRELMRNGQRDFSNLDIKQMLRTRSKDNGSRTTRRKKRI